VLRDARGAGAPGPAARAASRGDPPHRQQAVRCVLLEERGPIPVSGARSAWNAVFNLGLTAQEKNDLIEYLKSLPSED
jgi:hypothetical protein